MIESLHYVRCYLYSRLVAGAGPEKNNEAINKVLSKGNEITQSAKTKTIELTDSAKAKAAEIKNKITK